MVAAAIMLGAIAIEWFEGSIDPPGFLAGALLLIATAGYASLNHSFLRARVAALAGLIVSTHLLVAFSGKGDSALYSFYFIPIVFAAGFFGLAGSAISGAIVTGLYATFFLHATLAELQAELLEETITLMFIALLSGYLVDRLQTEEQLRLEAERLEKDRERLAEVGLLAAQVAHEFRNPLQVIEGAAETIDARGWIAESGRSLFADLRNEARRMSLLASDFLIYGRPGIADRTPAALADLVERAGIGLKELTIENTIPAAVTSSVDPEAMERVFRNLLANAVHSGARRMTVLYSATAKEIQLRFQDDGGGVNEKVRANLFEPFRTGRPGGVGLGLAIARRIIDAHGGKISLAETSASGTTFEIVLPRDAK